MKTLKLILQVLVKLLGVIIPVLPDSIWRKLPWKDKHE